MANPVYVKDLNSIVPCTWHSYARPVSQPLVRCAFIILCTPALWPNFCISPASLQPDQVCLTDMEVFRLLICVGHGSPFGLMCLRWMCWLCCFDILLWLLMFQFQNRSTDYAILFSFFCFFKAIWLCSLYQMWQAGIASCFYNHLFPHSLCCWMFSWAGAEAAPNTPKPHSSSE